MKQKDKKRAYATYTVLEHVDLEPETNIVRPSEEAIQMAKEFVDENEK